MDVLLVGATGTIGSAVDEALRSAGHRVVRVARTGGDLQADLEDVGSLADLYTRVPEERRPLDAVVCCAGVARFGPIQELEPDDYHASVRNKLMGQVNLVRLGLEHVRAGGSFTLTSGTLSQEPDPGTAAVAMVGGALESWVRAAALDLGDHRVNVVSPAWVKETMEAMGVDPGPGQAAADVARTYVRAVEGTMSGETLYVE